MLGSRRQAGDQTASRLPGQPPDNPGRQRPGVARSSEIADGVASRAGGLPRKYIQRVWSWQEIIWYRLGGTDQETENSAIDQEEGLAISEAFC